MKVKVVDTKGNNIEELSISDNVFGIKPNLEVLKQYLRVYLANKRQGTVSTKTKAEVSGGGKKPWAQKGTGRARQGSTRSPQWRHGGVAHGPKPKDWSLELPKKVRKLAIKSALSSVFEDKQALVIDSLKMDKPSTKDFVSIMTNLKLEGKTLFVLPQVDMGIIKSASNIKGVTTVFDGILNAHDLMNKKHVVFIKDALVNLEKKYETK